MGDFRRTVIAVAESVQVIWITIFCIAFGIGGMQIMRLLLLASGERPTEGNAFIGFVLGAGVGFTIASTLAAVFFALTETAANTRRLVELIEQSREDIHTT
jgi:hypothetical protein